MTDLLGWAENAAGTGICHRPMFLLVQEGQLVLGSNLCGGFPLPLAALNLVLEKLGLQVAPLSRKPRYIVRPVREGHCENCHLGPLPRFEVPWVGITGTNEGQAVCATCKPVFLHGVDYVEVSS